MFLLKEILTASVVLFAVINIVGSIPVIFSIIRKVFESILLAIAVKHFATNVGKIVKC
jgi:small neutral amino acid transporter SnatA (MarC family)